MKRYLKLIFLLIFSICFTKAEQTVSCTGHDACRNNIWNGEYNIYCGGSNSERTCRSTTLNCGKNSDCSIKTQGSGHDAYQYSTVNAKESSSFKLTCQASGQRDCKSITIWCPQIQGSICECISCPNTVTMKCVQGISCNSVNNAKIEYVEPDKYQIPDSVWKKDISNTGKRPDCDKVFINSNGNYLWATLNSCKKRCLEESTGLCNIISRYGENIKTADDLYHCYFYKCMNPNNFTWIDQNQWGNGASFSTTYILPIRHYTIDSRFINVTRYIDKLEYTPYQIKSFGTTTCPLGFSQIINKDECHNAQKKVARDTSFQGIPHPEQDVSGCYYDNLHNRVYLPPESHQSGINHMAPICKANCETYVNLDASDPLVNFCINSIPIKSQLQKSSNRAFQIKSWDSGCKKRENTLNKCKLSCNSPQGCCGITCQSNSCSGGGCCQASKNICKKACEFYFNPVSYNVVNVFQNITNWINHTNINWINKTKINWINKTKINWINKTKINWINKTKWNNLTDINWINKTKINWINKTRWVIKEKIYWLNKSKLNDRTEINQHYYSIKRNNTNYNNSNLNKIYMYGLIISFILNVIFIIFILWKFSIIDFLNKINDELCCCNLIELYDYFISGDSNNSNNTNNTNNLEEKNNLEDKNNNIQIESNNPKDESKVVPIFLEKEVTTPNGSIIRRRMIEI